MKITLFCSKGYLSIFYLFIYAFLHLFISTFLNPSHLLLFFSFSLFMHISFYLFIISCTALTRLVPAQNTPDSFSESTDEPPSLCPDRKC